MSLDLTLNTLLTHLCPSHLVRLDQLCPPVKGLPPEDPAEGTVVPRPNLGHDLVHRPPV